MKDEKEREYVNTPSGILARLMSKIKLKLNINYIEFIALIDRWAINENGGKSDTKSQIRRTNAISSFSKPEISIKTLFRFFNVIKIKKVKFTLQITTFTDKEIEVNETINFFEEKKLIIKPKKRIQENADTGDNNDEQK